MPQPIRPYVPAIARFLIVVTFLEGGSGHAESSRYEADDRCPANPHAVERSVMVLAQVSFISGMRGQSS